MPNKSEVPLVSEELGLPVKDGLEQYGLLGGGAKCEVNPSLPAHQRCHCRYPKPDTIQTNAPREQGVSPDNLCWYKMFPPTQLG
jgi:hypothetical protein